MSLGDTKPRIRLHHLYERRQSLRRNITSLLGTLTLAAMLLVGASTSYFIYRTERESWQGRQEEAARNAADKVAAFIAAAQGDLLTNVGVVDRDYLSARPGVLKHLLEVNPAFLEVIRLDSTGNVLAGAYTDAPILANLFTIPQSNWFVRAAAGQPYVGSFQISSNDEPYLILAEPAPEAGVVAARLRMNVLWDTVAPIRFGQGGQAYVLDSQGRYLAHNDLQLVLSGASLADHAELVSLLGSPSAGWHGEYTNPEGVKVIRAAAPVAGTDWVVITELPQSEAHAASQTAMVVLGGGTAVFGLLGMWLTRQLLVRHLFQPVEQLRAGAERIGQGDLSHRIDIARRDEIGLVAEAFNDMAGRLHDRERQLAARTEALATEVEERKRAEQALQKAKDELEIRVAERTAELSAAEAKFRTLVEQIPAITYLVSLEKENATHYVSPQIETMLGFTRDEWLADPDLWRNQLHPDDRERVLAEDQHTFATGEPFYAEYRIFTKDGRVVWLHDESRWVRDETGRPRFTQGIELDITARKEVEEALRESEERYALAVRGANDGLWDWNLKTNEIYFSPRWKSMLGYDEDPISGDPQEWFSRVRPDDLSALQAEIASHLEGHTPHFENEYRMRHADGSYRWMLSRGMATWDADGQAYRMAGSQTDITARKHSEEQLIHDALHDALTGLPNRALFMDRLGQVFERAKRYRSLSAAVLFVDLDRFKVVNDSLGHAAGDQLLIAVARRLKACLRPEDTVARLGGDEFAILLEGIMDVSDTIRVAERIQKQLISTTMLNGVERSTTASIGIALLTRTYEQPDDLLRDADTAMYRAKALGRARHQIFDADMHANAVALLRLEEDLRRAVDRQEFQIVYQPIVALNGGQVAGVEALLRWQHPGRGLVSPLEFIAVAEDTGLILPIGEYVLRAACAQTQAWRDAGHTNLWVSVNISARQFQDQNLLQVIQRALAHTGLPGDGLRLEITESVAMMDLAYSVRTLNELNAMGVHIAIDDFGQGHSSLGYLRRFPLKVLKIDRSFIQDLSDGGGGEAITSAIIAMAHSLNLEVVAEGVETEEQTAFLQTQACDMLQGYLFSRPKPAQELSQLLSYSLTLPMIQTEC